MHYCFKYYQYCSSRLFLGNHSGAEITLPFTPEFDIIVQIIEKMVVVY